MPPVTKKRRLDPGGKLLTLLGNDFKFNMPPHKDGIFLHQDILSHHDKSLDRNVLLALTLTDACSQQRRGWFFWLPTIHASASQRRELRRLRDREEGANGDKSEIVSDSATSHADLLFWSGFEWTEANCQHWHRISANAKRSLCQGQLNLLQGRKALVLPVYVDIIGASKWDVNAGPGEGAHDGAMLIYRAENRDKSSQEATAELFQAFVGALFEFRGKKVRSSKGQAGVFKRAIRDRTPGKIGEPLQWAAQWFESHKVVPASNLGVISALESLSSSESDFLERWEDALSRSYGG